MAVAENTGYPVGWFKLQDIAKDLYECAICLEVVKDAMQDRDCGHLFCRYCIERVLKVQAQCPTCRKEISEEMIFPDKNANRAIGKLEVNCPSTRCGWDGTLNSLLQEHNPRCPFFLLNCNYMGCNIQVICQELEVHLTKCEHRTIVCEHCKQEYVFKNKDEHLSTCLFRPVECENKCSEKDIPRNEMKEHLDTVCSKTIIECKYSEFGCEYQCKRQEMKEHLNQEMEEHLDLSTLEISQLKEQHENDIDELKEEIEKLKRQTTHSVIPLIVPHIMIITDFNRKFSEAKEGNTSGTIFGGPFYTSPHGYKFKMRVDLNETREEYKDHLGVYLYVMKSEHDAILSWPFKKEYIFTLIDQQDNEQERNNIVKTLTPKEQNRPKDKENEGRGCVISHKTLLTRKYIKDDTVFITVNIEQ